MSKGITKKSDDHSKWYTDVITKAELADYGPVKGTMVIKPYGFSIWELVKDEFDKQFKNTGHSNAYFPLFIPKSFIQKEAQHVEGFSPELATVTHAGGKKLEEPLIVRPTSETIINHMFAKWISSHRDLPVLINQWANVVRWEMRTRLFLRTSEFLWQEGHTAHASKEEATNEALQMLDIYEEFVEEMAAVAVIKGLKSDMEKFAGAEKTYSVEAMMLDKKALQAGTSHELGQNFAKAFDIEFSDENNKLQNPYQTSWGVSTRLIGMIIMAHGDDKGLKLPPNLAPIQIVIVPIIPNEDKAKIVNEKVKEVHKLLQNYRVEIDDRTEVSPGYKFNEWELKGVPLRIEIGPNEVNENKVVISRRDIDKSKVDILFENINHEIEKLLLDIQTNLLKKSKEHLKQNTTHVETFDELIDTLNKKSGFVTCYWKENKEDELKVKESTSATIRCYPLSHSENKQSINQKDDGKFTIFSKAY